MSRKVVFSPLQRLDLIDLNAIQDLTQDHYDSFIGEIFGTQRGVLTPWQSVTVSYTPTHKITFDQDFSFIGEKQDGSAYLGTYLGSLGSFIDLSALKTLASDANAPSNLTSTNPSITSSNYDPTTHDPYFQYIYCRLIETDGSQASRKFWDVSNQNEVVNSTNTRTVDSFEFTVSTEDSLTQPSTGNKWTKIARIFNFGTHGNDTVVFSDQSDPRPILPWTISDDIINSTNDSGRYFNSDNSLVQGFHSKANSIFGGLAGAIQTLSNRLQDLKTNGALDSQSKTSKSELALPDYSLQGLSYFITTQVQGTVPESVSYVISMTAGHDSNSANVNPDTTFQFNKITQGQTLLEFTPRVNYRVLAGVTGANLNSLDTIEKKIKAVSGVFLDFEDNTILKRSNQHLQLSIEPVIFNSSTNNQTVCVTGQWSQVREFYPTSLQGYTIVENVDYYPDLSGAQSGTTGIDLQLNVPDNPAGLTNTDKMVGVMFVVTVTLHRRTIGLVL